MSEEARQTMANVMDVRLKQKRQNKRAREVFPTVVGPCEHRLLQHTVKQQLPIGSNVECWLVAVCGMQPTVKQMSVAVPRVCQVFDCWL